MRVFIWLYADKTRDLRRPEGVYARPLLPFEPYLSTAVSVHVTHFRFVVRFRAPGFQELYASPNRIL